MRTKGHRNKIKRSILLKCFLLFAKLALETFSQNKQVKTMN